MTRSKKRLEMGEDGWADYQKDRKRKKAQRYYEEKGRYATAWRIRAKEQLIAYKGGKCEICGYNKNIPRVYVFHHKNPEEKDFGIASYKVLNMERLKKEVDKCLLLCSNCHAEVHYEIDKYKRQKLMASHDRWLNSRLSTIQCVCGRLFKPHRRSQTGCAACYEIRRRKVKNRPTKSQLVEMLSTMTWRGIGKKYSVSDNTIKKWAKRMDITWTPHIWRNKISIEE